LTLAKVSDIRAAMNFLGITARKEPIAEDEEDPSPGDEDAGAEAEAVENPSSADSEPRAE